MRRPPASRPSFLSRLRAAFRTLLGEEQADLAGALRHLADEVKQLREAAERRTIHIDRVEQMTVEQLFHIIGRLEVDQLDGTLNVGFSRNLRVNPKPPPPPKSPSSGGTPRLPAPRRE